MVLEALVCSWHTINHQVSPAHTWPVVMSMVTGSMLISNWALEDNEVCDKLSKMNTKAYLDTNRSK